MKTNNCFLLVLLFLLQTTFLSAQTFRPEMIAQIDSLVPDAVNDTTPGCLIALVHKGETILAKAYGKANLAYGIDNDHRMVYNIGSVSKQFLGYAFAMLHDQGRLDLDDPVGKYLDDWPEFEQEVTLRHILTHTSGYREAYTMSNLAGRIVGQDYLSRDECLEVVRRQPALEFEPGSRYTYNSTAWVILAEVLEEVTGTPADDWVTRHILEPLGMEATEIESYVGEVIPNAAESYYVEEGQGYVNAESNRAIFGAAEVYSNLEDLSKWINNYRTALIGGKAVQELFTQAYMLSNGTSADYGLGIGISEYRGTERWRHGGSHEAFLTMLSYYPEHDLGIIILSNYGGRGWISESDVADILLADVLEPEKQSPVKGIKMHPKALQRFVGNYLRDTRNRTMEISVSEDSLTINGRRKLIPIGKNLFSSGDGEARYRFDPSADGGQRLTIRIDGGDYIYERLPTWEGDTQALQAYTGDYWSE
ncbi:MAG: beta-lactamase family protein, partial [Flavobacteriales bacterium]|nr:beta-lactamase family protein [Flavobacteriales bacterium]